MSIKVDLSYPHEFECRLVEGLPSSGTARQHYFPPDRPAGQDGICVAVVPTVEGQWVGTFAFGAFGPTGISEVLSMPDPTKLCVISRGAGYVVSVSNPADWETIKAVPIVDARTVPAAGIVIFANFTEILAYGRDGEKWRTRRLAWDGLSIIAIGERTLVGQYWDIRDEGMRRFEVDMETGVARGGMDD